MRTGIRFWVPVLAFCFATALLVVPQAALAQNPTGSIDGKVTDPDGAPLPGVTVSATSPRLQGTRVVTTGTNGSYKLALLPPGEYTITYELNGFATATREVRVNAAQSVESDIEMQLAAVAEEIVVTSRQETISETGTGASTFTKEEVEALPVDRDIEDAVLLSPGTHATGPGGNVSISGAMSFENLYTINGVVINENVRGQELPLFIEEAIQETTTLVSGISAEYGRFSGGVVNAITKSGGNQFEGSFRTSFDNDDWTERNRIEVENDIESTDEINETFEATLGGYFLKDHLWFFGAGRDRDTATTDTTSILNIPFDQTDEEQRLEGKLTISPSASHSIIGSYTEIDRVRSGDVFRPVSPMDLRSVNDNREDPQEIISGNYTGILTPSFFVEAQYSERELLIGIGSGGPQDLIEGTRLISRSQPGSFHAPTFCGECETEERSNENFLAKASYFLTTENAGTHDLVFGYDTFDDIRFAINHQSGSDFQVWADRYVVDDQNNIFPIWGPRTWIGWWAVFGLDEARGTDFTTNSLYVNDAWQLNDKWSFNAGVRFDENDGQNQAGDTTADDSKFSPRLGLSYDVKGDGDLVINASFGTYVAAVANTRANATSDAGALGLFLSGYSGPFVNNNPGCLDNPSPATCQTGSQALSTLFDWYLANGGTTDLSQVGNTQIPNFVLSILPGPTSIIPDTLKSPASNELTVGFSKRLGTKGLFRADAVYREFEDFYSNRVTLDTGVADTPQGPADVTEIGNFGDSVLEREYLGLHTQFRYRATDRLTLSGNWTWSELEGNINGETGGSGPVPSSPFSYPEFQVPFDHPNSPFHVGRLGADQEHKVRAWAIYDIFRTENNHLSVSLLQNFFTGTPYGAGGALDTTEFVDNPGYVRPLNGTNAGVSFTDRDAFELDDISRTDLSLNYSFRWNAFGRQLEVFLQPEVINLLDEDGVISVNATTNDSTDGGICPDAGGPGVEAPCLSFNPFAGEEAIEGVHWVKGDDFGQPTDANDFQQARTFRFSVGFRF